MPSTRRDAELMNVLAFEEAHARLGEVMDAICRRRVPAVVFREGGDPVVMLPLEEFTGLQETMHLLGSIGDACRLMASIEQLRARGTVRRPGGDDGAVERARRE